MFNLLRHYAITSFAGIIVATVLVTGLYRHLEIQESIDLARKSDVVLADNLLKSVMPKLGDYLNSVSNLGPGEISKDGFPSAIRSSIAGLTSEAPLARVTIYNNAGVVVYSTRESRIGTAEANKPGFAAASLGKPFSDMVYRDSLSRIGPATEEDNLLRTYVPVRRGSSGPAVGVFAIHTDLSPVVAQNEQELLTAAAGFGSILLLLYCVLLIAVLRAGAAIDKHQTNIRERTEALEALSAQLLRNEEKEKEQLADGLHEDFAQTLSAIKLRIEDSLKPRSANASSSEALKSAASALQGVIEELQQTAMELRPPSLGELGLLPTIQWFCREFEHLNAAIRVEREISLYEEQIPEQLRIVIYRIIEAVFREIARSASTDRIQLALRMTADAIMLAIEYTPYGSTIGAPASQSAVSDPRRRFVVAQERTIQSGGTFLTAKSNEGRIALQAYWPESTEFVRGHNSRPELDEAAGAANRASAPLQGTADHVRPEAA